MKFSSDQLFQNGVCRRSLFRIFYYKGYKFWFYNHDDTKQKNVISLDFGEICSTNCCLGLLLLHVSSSQMCYDQHYPDANKQLSQMYQIHCK